MLITSLTLQDFKSYVQATFAFAPGATAIIGANGAGKSTLLEAIGFALFDYQEKGTSLGALVREGARSGRVLVGITSSFDERGYDVERCFSATTTTRYRVHDRELGTYVAEGREAVGGWLRQHLGHTSGVSLADLFANTIGVPQGTFTAPFLLPASSRKTIFDPLLQVDEYQQAAKKLLDTSSLLRAQGEEIARAIANLQGRLAQLPAYRAEEGVLSASLATLEGQLAQLAEEIATQETATRVWEEAAVTARAAQGHWERALAQQAAQEARQADAERALNEATIAQERVAATQAGYEAYLAAQAELTRLEAQRTQRDQVLREQARAEQEWARLRGRLESLEAELATFVIQEARLAALAPHLAAQEARESALREAEEEARRLDEVQRRHAEATQELQRATQQAASLRERSQQALAVEKCQAVEQARLEGCAVAERTARDARTAAFTELERVREQSQTLAATAAARCPVCEAELTPAHRAEMLARNEALIQSLTVQLTTHEARLAELTREQRRAQQELRRLERELREAPAQQELRGAEEALAQRAEAVAQCAATAAALAEAPRHVAEQRQALVALGDPRREALVIQANLAGRGAKQRARDELAAQSGTQEAALAERNAALAAFAGLDVALAAAQRARAQHQGDHQTYLAHATLAAQREERAARVATLTVALRDLAAQLTDLDAARTTALARYDAAAHAQAKSRLAEAQRQHAASTAQREERQRRFAVVRAELEALALATRELEARSAAGIETERLRGLVEMSRDILKKAGPFITQQVVRRISRDASAFYGDLMGERGGRLQWSEDYELTVEMRGQERPFRQLSGGEQMAAALALRLALLRQATAINVAFFDEPTAHLDAARRDELAERIMGVRSFGQLFVISHDDTFERAAQSHVRIVKDENGSHAEQGE
jgi:exonuclease SbcC